MIASAARIRPRSLLRSRLSGQRKFAQLWTTIALFLAAYLFGAVLFDGMRDGQAFTNLLVTTPFLLICAVGETFVIVSGGIDLSVSGILALTTVVTAALLQQGWNPGAVIVLMLLMGLLFGLVMGVFITYLKVQPFIATLAGMWLARGLSYVISDAEIRISDPFWKTLAGTRIHLPVPASPTEWPNLVFLAPPTTGPYITVPVAAALAVLLVGLYLAHLTLFGRTVYAIGGNNGANELSARLMGLPVNRTKILVYMLSGFCSALAGLAYSIYVGSGHGGHAPGFELTVIAAVVIGGVALTGGEGYLIGALFGVLITQLIQTLIQFNGQFSSWWSSIVIGLLMLFFIGVQSLLAALTAGRLAKRRAALSHALTSARHAGRRRLAVAGTGAVGVLAIAALLVMVTFGGGGTPTGSGGDNEPGHCQLKPTRHADADQLVKDGAVIAYERNGGSNCIDELYAIYADGRVVAYDGQNKREGKASADAVGKLVKSISDLGWYTPDMYTTIHTPCGACYSYYISVSFEGNVKAVGAVDGGTDTPDNYLLIATRISAILPKLEAQP